LLNSSQTINEDNASLSITVTRSGDLSTASTVDYATSDGTAEAGVDYGPVSGTLSFASGESSKNIYVPIFEDEVYENPGDLLADLKQSDRT
jgi:hypothetical protein